MNHRKLVSISIGASLVLVGMALGHAPAFAQSAPHVMPPLPSHPVLPPPPPPPVQQGQGFNGCGNGPDCVPLDLSTQVHCTEVAGQPTQDPRWVAGLSLQVDNQIAGGDIVAYRIQWFNGSWSEYFAPGVNDVDYKFNPGNHTMRRMWSYFYDHSFSYIVCR